HGVRALRLNPVGGSRAIHGRAGLLAHTYMLGPRGDSNGCISFKDYNRFLQAYLRGEVRRLIVVASAS
uniref:tlde1 domain-containing protein n=1 Tax=Acinetobacter baumannii TaxID=470 RepID=UPI0013D0B5EC